MPASKGGDGQKIITEENREIGSVDWSIYRKYFQAIGGIASFVVLLFAFVLESGSRIATDAFLAHWTSQVRSDNMKYFG